ncbi:hypothetical protein [Halococcus sp. PRR34]|uniref:hypothetical protein n=1 Tax=Halococcus sp. PRR34 TaxID=3020830 RepID=UPI0023606833|nr:hypothetical protein [Halococcus sp. PRR34]
MAGKTIYLPKDPVTVTPGTTVADLKAETGARSDERLTSWQHGTLWYWADDQEIYNQLVEGQRCAWCMLDGRFINPNYSSSLPERLYLKITLANQPTWSNDLETSRIPLDHHNNWNRLVSR